MSWALVVGAAAVLAGHPGAARADGWTEEKCRRYDRAWRHLLAAGPGLGPDFRAAQERFIAGGCLDPGQVCPVSPAELALADTLTLMAVADGMAGSFLPFGCPDAAPPTDA